MGLLAWYPLIKDTENYGIDGQNLEVKGEVTYTEGKIGKSATFVGNTVNCLYRNGFKLEDNFTWCAWIKITNNNVQQYLLSEGRDYDLRGFNIYCSTTPALLATWGGKNTGQYLTILSPMELNTWYHIAITVNSEQGVKAYVNGEFVKEGLYSKPDYTYSNDKFVIGKMAYFYSNNNNYFPTSGQIQDVRIYNETLSPMQIKLISQGLVAHYLLNNNGNGNNNLAIGSNTNNINTNQWVLPLQNGKTTRTIELDENNINCVKIERDNTAYSGWGFLAYNNIARNQLKTNTEYFISFDCQTSVAGTITLFGLKYSDVTNSMTSTVTQIQTVTKANQWCHMQYSCLTKESFDDIETNSQIIYLGLSNSLKDTGVILKFKNIKLEEGNKETPWCPNSTDAIYNQLGYNDNIEYDVSGYYNNGTKYNITDYTSDTPRYSVATKFNGTNSYINIGQGGKIKDEITVNIWGYMDDWTKYNGRLISCTEGGGWNFEASSGKIHFAIGTGSTSNVYKNAPNYPLLELSSGWHMFTGTYDGFTIKQYIDGVFTTSNNAYTTKTPIYYNNNNPILIGAEASGNQAPTANYYFSGNISDVRIYATALSELDIQSLYKNSAFVDSSGNVYSTEYIES